MYSHNLNINDIPIFYKENIILSIFENNHGYNYTFLENSRGYNYDR